VWVVKTFKDKALVYSILFKSAVYAAILVCMDILEEVMVGIFHGKPAAQGMTEVGGGGMKGIVLVGIMAFVLLIPLFAFREIPMPSARRSCSRSFSKRQEHYDFAG